MKKLIIVATAGLLLYAGYTRNKETIDRMIHGTTAKTDESAAASPAPAAQTATPPAVAAASSVTPVPVATAAPEVAPAPLPVDRTLYLLTRVSTATDSGLVAANAGAKVKIIDRNADGTVNITDGTNKFTVAENQLSKTAPVIVAAAPPPAGAPRPPGAAAANPAAAARTPYFNPNSQNNAIEKMRIKSDLQSLGQQRARLLDQIAQAQAQIRLLSTKFERHVSHRAVEAGTGGNSISALQVQVSDLQRQIGAVDAKSNALQTRLRELQ